MPVTYKHPRPMVTVDVVIFSPEGEKVLLIKRAREPFKGKWALPGGFVGMAEELKEAANRELEEETGLTGVSLRQVRAFDTLGRDPRGRVITIAFCGTMDPKTTPIRAASDAAAVEWVNLEPFPELTFDHGEIVRAAHARLF